MKTGNETQVEDNAEGLAPVPKTMRAAVARKYGDAGGISIEEVPTPTPKRGEILLQVKASSLNALDWHFLSGTPYFLRLIAGLRRPKRIIHGADGAGVVVAVGSDVETFKPGDAVFGETDGGGFADYLTVDASHVVAMPDGVSFTAAGATPVAGLTALQGLRTHAELRAGEHVLINGAAGGVGTFAVQLAAALGAAEITAVCSTGNVEMLKALGADHVIDYLKEDFVEAGARFDVMMDNVGNRSPAECLSVLRPGGRYLAVSGPKTNRLLGPIPHLAKTWLKFRRPSQTFHQFTATPEFDDLTFLGELLAAGKIRPEIDRVIGLDGVAEALQEISGGHTKAKILFDPTNQ